VILDADQLESRLLGDQRLPDRELGVLGGGYDKIPISVTEFEATGAARV